MSIAKLSQLAKSLRDIPVRVAQNIASSVAPDLTNMARASFDAGQTVYGDARPTGKEGNALTLRRTGALRSGVRFTAIGTRLRAVLTVRYARYMVKYGILPRGGSKIHVAWQESISNTAKDEIQKAVA